jgi:hypothetical protein
MTDERHQCEVRHVLALRVEDRGKAISYMALVEQKRGAEAARQLKVDAADQWNKGNRGEKGDWR